VCNLRSKAFAPVPQMLQFFVTGLYSPASYNILHA
jgi:hypothetical protein